MAKPKKKTLHPALLKVLEAVPEDLKDDETSNPKSLAFSADRNTGFVHYAALTKLCRLNIEARYYDIEKGPFKISLMFRNPVTYSTPRTRTYNVKSNSSRWSNGSPWNTKRSNSKYAVTTVNWQ